jgi:hypothetical protein
VIIDCHGHYTTAPQAHTDWRTAAAGKQQVFERNVRRVYPRLDASLKAKGR